MTRDVGYWALVAAGGLGLVALFVSLLRTGDDGRAGLDPWVAALGAMATIAAVIGPLIPIDDADIDLNWSSAAGDRRADGCGSSPASCNSACCCCAACSASCSCAATASAWRSAARSAPAGWCSPQRPSRPTGRSALAVGNPDFTDLEPHIVTIVGVGLMLFFGLVATAMALIDDR